MKKLRKKNFFRHEKSANLGDQKSVIFSPLWWMEKKAKICIYWSAEISAWARAMQKNVPKKFQSEGLRRIWKKKVMLFTFHGVNLKSEIVEKNNFLFRLYLLILPCFEIRKTHFQNIWWTRNFVFFSQKKLMYIFYI